MMKSIVLGGTVLAGTVTLASCGPDAAEGAGNTREFGVVARRDIDVNVEATGNINPTRIIEVKSKASGEVTAIHVESGDVVTIGQLLVEIDPRDVNNAFDQAQADLDVARARLNNSKAQRTSMEVMFAGNVVTEQEMESARLSVASDSASFIRAQSNVQLAEERKNDVTIRAPLVGTVISEALEIGMVIASASQNVSGGTTLLTMADLSEMQVRTLIDETDLGQVVAGMPVNITVDAFAGRVFEGTVLKIEPQAVVEQNVTMFPILVVLDNTENLLRPGMNADVEIEVAQRRDVIAVPSAAVVEQRTAVAAGSVLGLSEEEVNSGLNPPRVASAAEAQGPGTPDSATASGEQRGGRQGASGGRAGRGGGARGGRGGGRGGGGGLRPGQNRTGVVFVTEAGRITARRVTLGVNDWEWTEVISGLAEGDSVVLVSVAQLQQAQQDFQDRMRQNMGGFPGTGNTRGGRGGGGGRGGRF
jgi:HlyD family secretion protein